MDPTLLTLLPTGGVATALLVVIGYLLRQNHLDRVQYRNDVAAIDARATAASLAQEARHAAEITAFGAKITSLEAKVASALDALETERKRRWAAEDAAAHYRLLAEKGSPSE